MVQKWNQDTIFLVPIVNVEILQKDKVNKDSKAG